MKRKASKWIPPLKPIPRRGKAAKTKPQPKAKPRADSRKRSSGPAIPRGYRLTDEKRRLYASTSRHASTCRCNLCEEWRAAAFAGAH